MNQARRVALVTGAQQGIGRPAAVALAKTGTDIAVNRLDDRAGAEEIAEAIASLGPQACPVQADIGSVSAIDGLVEDVVSRFGQIDILVSNPGIYLRQAFVDLDEST